MATRASEELHEARLNHLHTASRLAFRICPQLAAFYGNEFLTALGGQRATNTIARHQCTYCGSPLVDGRSISRVSVVRSTKRQPQRTSHGICKGTWGRQQTQPVANKPGTVVDTSRRRVIKIRLNDASSATGHSKPTKEESARARQDQKNTIHYICELCDSRLVFPGSTKSGLQAAGLAGGSDANSGLKNKSKGAALEPPKYLGPTKPERAIHRQQMQKRRQQQQQQHQNFFRPHLGSPAAQQEIFSPVTDDLADFSPAGSYVGGNLTSMAPGALPTSIPGTMLGNQRSAAGNMLGMHRNERSPPQTPAYQSMSLPAGSEWFENHLMQHQSIGSALNPSSFAATQHMGGTSAADLSPQNQTLMSLMENEDGGSPQKS
ncbi:hypothetical protein GGI25_003804 [Coemansia spiralis]|uniref:Uncharacterized protein n=1 Tax=Coemansia spiralis TaxID=417178 RepID=A0A9W8G5E3_9FUNG|nr:hypothetical protein GGI25_003804 [Coemansia spiralis]